MQREKTRRAKKSSGASDKEADRQEVKETPRVSDDAPVIGLATMEDFLEELIQDEIIDETDAWHYDRQAQAPSVSPEGSPNRRQSTNHAAPVTKVAVKSGHVDLTAHLRKLAPGTSAPGPAASFTKLFGGDPMAA